MTNMQLELVGARECGFNVRSWAAAIDEIDRVTDWSVIKVPDPNDVIGQVCDQYHVKVRVGEAAVVLRIRLICITKNLDLSSINKVMAWGIPTQTIFS
jgi:hypothetical protein